ncbi:hypothetical protein BH11ARM2_BH11ARM2_15410 [soil metagenome]
MKPFLLASVLMLIVVGCGSKDADESATTPTTSTTPADPSAVAAGQAKKGEVKAMSGPMASPSGADLDSRVGTASGGK